MFVPNYPIELPEHKEVTVTLNDDEPVGSAMPAALPRYDDPSDPMPEGGVALVEWWSRHRLQIDPVIGDKIARSKAYGFNEEPDDES